MYACEVMIICRQDVRPSESCRFGFQTALGLSVWLHSLPSRVSVRLGL
ncbi:hypothetical protein NEIFLAOT_02100 [Neisseria flavescens NRL30031/H210]|uniref:Uncharacterized protein n=1 Tax=Neisseria flavescens NRL30031/H210 TaxID=546264 RepID=C0EQ58_NEIFL|nr:hypothetical protein NEIFLAOT_02100 [Neisseria flavescens NRL30031/H210]